MEGPGRSRPMQGTNHEHDAHGIRRRRRGVATIVGALLVLLIATVAFTLVFTQAVPVWMAQDESGLASQVQASFAQLQSTVNLQGAFGSPQTGITSIGLSSSSVPVLATPTQGSLLFEANTTPASFATLSVVPGAGGTGAYARNVSLGEISAVLPNRYIPAQTVTFQGGGVFVAGASFSSARAFYHPLFSIGSSGANTSLDLTVVSMTGSPVSVSSSGTSQILDTISSSSEVVSHGAPQAGGGFGPTQVTIQIGSAFACAWYGAFDSALAASGIPSANYTLTSSANCVSGDAGGGIVALTLDSVTYASVTWLSISIGLEAGGA